MTVYIFCLSAAVQWFSDTKHLLHLVEFYSLLIVSVHWSLLGRNFRHGGPMKIHEDFNLITTLQRCVFQTGDLITYKTVELTVLFFIFILQIKNKRGGHQTISPFQAGEERNTSVQSSHLLAAVGQRTASHFPGPCRRV